jgi:imidazolonepropionase
MQFAEARMTHWDLLLTDARVATMERDVAPYGVIDDGAIAIADGVIAWVGSTASIPNNEVREARSLSGHWVTPALIDCHTHLVFGGDRSAEFEQRLSGVSYEEIARAGGGILSTVHATRNSSRDELFESASKRLQMLQADGVATVEIKTGYGLDVATEIKMLEVANRLSESSAITIQTTLLAAHAIPPEYKNDADSYIELICEELIPLVAERELANAVDAYCEEFAFSAEQVTKVFEAARRHDLPVKLHADQLSDGGGAALAASFDALSADHLEYASSDGIAAMANSGTTAVLLPGAYLTLNETQLPPVDAMRDSGVAIALATDCNPGTSPLTSVREAMALGCRLFRLTPEECLAGVTRAAAGALGLSDRGTIEIGKRADLAIWDISHPRDLSYWLGSRSLSGLFISGRDVSLTRP